ncbi:MAG TPA: hypothetical protein VE132_08150 [Micromonosporaceae bacterium]|nr:hypothetical protein [Micromonosporaceae bacterium]
MTIRTKQVLAAVLALSAAYVGAWAAAFPLSFYRSFPLPGRGWVAMLGPYNEHLTRDVGGLYLALFVMTAWAVVRPGAEIFRVAGAAWLVFNVVHFAFHLSHLGMFGIADQIGNVVALGGSTVLSALLVIPAHTSEDSAAPYHGRLKLKHR